LHQYRKNGQKVVELLCHLSAELNLSFKASTSDSMKHFIDEIFKISENSNIRNPSKLFPSRQTLSSSIQKEGNKRRELLKNKFQSANAICISLDHWQDPNRVYFLGICVHYFHEEEYKTHLLAIREVRNKTSEATKQDLKSVLIDYGIEDKVFFILSDGALRSAFTKEKFTEMSVERYFNFTSENQEEAIISLHSITEETLLTNNYRKQVWMHCSAHRLQLVLQHGFKDLQTLKPQNTISTILTYVKRLVQSLIKTNSQRKFKKTVKQECATRWDTLLEMIVSVIETTNEYNPDIINVNDLEHTILMYLKMNMKLLKTIRSIIEMFVTERLTLSVDGSPTLSRVLTSRHFLLQELKVNEEEINENFQNEQKRTIL